MVNGLNIGLLRPFSLCGRLVNEFNSSLRLSNQFNCHAIGATQILIHGLKLLICFSKSIEFIVYHPPGVIVELID